MFNSIGLLPATKIIINDSSVFRCALLALCIASSIYISKKLICLSAIQNNIFILIIGILLIGLDIYSQTFSLFRICGLICFVSYFMKLRFIKNILYFFVSTFCLSYSITSYILMILAYWKVIRMLELILCIFIGIYLIASINLIYKSYCIIISSFVYITVCFCFEIICINSLSYKKIIFDLLIYLFAFVINKIIEIYYRYLERELC